MVPMSRRAALRSASFIAAGVAAGSHLLATSAHAADERAAPKAVRDAIERAKKRGERVLTGLPSENGWEMEKVADDHGHIYTRPVPGTPVDVQMRMGDVELVLVHLIRRFHYEIDELRKGEVLGWRAPHAVRKGLPESNQASGIAVQIRPGFYPPGTRDGFFPNQMVVVRDILASCDGVVRWGGDDPARDEALFSIDVPPGDARLPQLAEKIRGWSKTPGEGAGAGVDPLQPVRRRAAERLARQQSS